MSQQIGGLIPYKYTIDIRDSIIPSSDGNSIKFIHNALQEESFDAHIELLRLVVYPKFSIPSTAFQISGVIDVPNDEFLPVFTGLGDFRRFHWLCLIFQYIFNQTKNEVRTATIINKVLYTPNLTEPHVTPLILTDPFIVQDIANPNNIIVSFSQVLNKDLAWHINTIKLSVLLFKQIDLSGSSCITWVTYNLDQTVNKFYVKFETLGSPERIDLFYNIMSVIGRNAFNPYDALKECMYALTL